jgi:hypothetical protein
VIGCMHKVVHWTDKRPLGFLPYGLVIALEKARMGSIVKTVVPARKFARVCERNIRN